MKQELLLDANLSILKRETLEVSIDIGYGAKIMCQQLAKLIKYSVPGAQVSTKDVENALRFVMRKRVEHINDVFLGSRAARFIYPELFSSVVGKIQPLMTDDGLSVEILIPFDEVEESGQGYLDKLNTLCERAKFSTTQGFPPYDLITSGVLSIQHCKDHYESSRVVDNSDLHAKIWVEYPFIDRWGECKYRLDEPGAVEEAITILVREARH